MRSNKGGGPLSKWSNWRILWILILFVVVAVAGMTISQQLLLDNARTMGKNLVTSYSTDEDRTLGEFEKTLSLGMAYLRDFTRAGADTDELEDWLMDVFNKRCWLFKRSIKQQVFSSIFRSSKYLKKGISFSRLP